MQFQSQHSLSRDRNGRGLELDDLWVPSNLSGSMILWQAEQEPTF